MVLERLSAEKIDEIAVTQEFDANNSFLEMVNKSDLLEARNRIFSLKSMEHELTVSQSKVMNSLTFLMYPESWKPYYEEYCLLNTHLLRSSRKSSVSVRSIEVDFTLFLQLAGVDNFRHSSVFIQWNIFSCTDYARVITAWS